MAYNPGVTDRSGEILAQGLNGTIAQFGQDMDLMRENERKRRTAAGQVQGMLAANPQLAQKADPALIQKLSMGKANLNDTLQLLGTLSTVQKQEEEQVMNQMRRQRMQAVAVQMKGYEQEQAQRARSLQQEDELNTRFDQAINQSKTRGVLPPDLQAKVAELAQSPAAQLRGMGVRLTPAIMADLAKAQMKPATVMPGSGGYRQVEMPGLGTMVIDVATGQPVDGGKIVKPSERSTKPSEADVSFETNISQGLDLIKKYRETVKKFGNFEAPGWVGNAEARAALKQIPYQLAIMHAKIADPSSVAREGEVAAAQKYMLPSGFFTANDTTLTALNGLEETFKGYASARAKAQGKEAPVEASNPSVAASSGTYNFQGKDYPITTITRNGKGQRGIVVGTKFYPIPN